jgi:hypothetical protein
MQMPFVAPNPDKFSGTSVGNGQCVAFARAAAALAPTSTWKKGVAVRGANINPGTAIATFSDDGVYENNTSGRSHAAIYLGQDATGIRVMDLVQAAAASADKNQLKGRSWKSISRP